MSIDFKEKYKDNNNLLTSPYDSRDYKFKDLIPLGAIRIPDNYESPKTPFIFDQGTSSECAACAYSTIRYLQEQNQSGITEPFSPSFQYANRLDGEDFEGMYLRSLCKKGLEGSIPYSVFPGFFPYNICKEKFESNKDTYLDMAKEFAIDSYYVCTSREQVQSAIITTGGVIIGIQVFNCFYTVGDDGYIKYDSTKDTKSYGGHAILLRGYKTDPETGKFYWIMQNSWGKEWGLDGCAYLPSEYPWIDNAYAIVDNNFHLKWDDYIKKYNLKDSNT